MAFKMSEDETFGGGDSIVGKTLGGGGRGRLVQGTTKLRPQYDRGQHFQPFYSPTTTQIPQHIPPKISEYIQTTLNRKRSNEEGAKTLKKEQTFTKK